MNQPHFNSQSLTQGHLNSRESLIRGTGPMARLIRAQDWSGTRLGPIERWSETHLCSVNIMLASRFPSLVFWGPDMIQFYNDAYLPLMGGKSPEALGQTARECWKEAWHIIGPELEAALTRGETTYHENMVVPVVRRGLLQDIHWTYSYSPIYTPDGEIGGILVVCQDITDQIVAIKNLRHSEDRARRILESIGDAVIVTDTETRITSMNPIAETFTGWSAEDAKGQFLSEVFHIVSEDSRDKVDSPAMNIMRRGTAAALENHTILIAKDGTETYIDDSGAPIRNDDGEVTGVVLVFRDIGVRRAAELARDAIAKQLRQVLDATTDAVLSVDRQWRITYLNDRAKAIIAPSGDVLGKDLWECFPGALYENSPYVEYYSRAMKERVSSQFGAYYPEPLNAWFEILAQPSEDGIILFFRDVSKQRREAEALRDSEERLSAIYSTSLEYIGLLTPEGTILDCNRASLEFAGNTREEVVGLKFWESPWFSCTPGAPEALQQAIARARSGEFVRYEAPLIRPSGETIWFDFAVSPVRNAQGEVIFLVPEGHDISSLKRAEESLRQSSEALAASQQELRWTVELSGPIPWTADTEGHLLDFSHNWLELTGLTREQALGQERMWIPHPDDRRRITTAWDDSLKSGEPYNVEHRIRTASDEYRWVRARAYPRRNDEGKIVKWYGTTEDIDERKRAENALIQSEKLAAVGRLASSIAHEINNPLESVTNLLYLSQNTSDPSAIQEYLQTAERELRRVSAITNQTLRFHKQSTSPRAVGCDDLIDNVLAVYQGRIVNSRIEVQRRKRASTAVKCFDGEVRQVLTNLVGNAIDAMHPKGGRLILRSKEATHWRTLEKGVVLTVADTGSGISPQTLKKVFEPFFTTKGFGGTGLGLWVSQEIVARHRGALKVRSSQREGGCGSVFTLFLPFEAVVR